MTTEISIMVLGFSDGAWSGRRTAESRRVGVRTPAAGSGGSVTVPRAAAIVAARRRAGAAATAPAHELRLLETHDQWQQTAGVVAAVAIRHVMGAQTAAPRVESGALLDRDRT